jgi:hypothetical protein
VLAVVACHTVAALAPFVAEILDRLSHQPVTVLRAEKGVLLAVMASILAYLSFFATNRPSPTGPISSEKANVLIRIVVEPQLFMDSMMVRNTVWHFVRG